MEFLYFKAAGKSLEVYKEVMAQLKKSNAIRRKTFEPYGVEKYILSGSRCVAVCFPNPSNMPAGFRQYKRENPSYSFPDTRTKEGRAWKTLFNSPEWESPSVRELTFKLGKGSGWLVYEDNAVRIFYIKAEEVGEAVILGVPRIASTSGNPPFVPPDAIPLKTSEYYALKEAHEAALTPSTSSTSQGDGQ